MIRERRKPACSSVADIANAAGFQVDFDVLSLFDKGRYPWTFDRRQPEVDQSAEINVRDGFGEHRGDAGIAQRPGRILCARAHAEIDSGNYQIAGLYL